MFTATSQQSVACLRNKTGSPPAETETAFLLEYVCRLSEQGAANGGPELLHYNLRKAMFGFSRKRQLEIGAVDSGLSKEMDIYVFFLGVIRLESFHLVLLSSQYFLSCGLVCFRKRYSRCGMWTLHWVFSLSCDHYFLYILGIAGRHLTTSYFMERKTPFNCKII